MHEQPSSKLKRNQHILSIRTSLKKIEIIGHNHHLIQAKLSFSKQECSDSESTVSSPNGREKEKECQIVEVFSKKYELLGKIGEGSNGVVHKCVKRKSGELFAVKIFVVQEEHVKNLMQNFKVLSSLNHPNIISHNALYIDMKKHEGWLVMDYVSGIPLDKASLKNEDNYKEVMKQLFEGLSYLHENKIVHRDIKPQNIIYDSDTEQIKLIDFGISRKFSGEGSNQSLWSNTGTLYYKAPEMFKGGYQQKVDVWAAGVLLYKLIWSHTPFESEYHSKTIENIKKASIYFPPVISKDYYPKLKGFISRILIRNDADRPTASKCLNDVWLRSEFLKLDDFFKEIPVQSSLKKENKLKHKFSDLTCCKIYFPPQTRKYILDIHCLDSEWEEES